jgi:hypothetical protein
MPTIQELGDRVKQKYPGAYDNVDSAELGRKIKQKYPSAYSQFTEIGQPQTNQIMGPQLPYKFGVKRTKEEQAARIANARAMEAGANAEAEKANSFWGKTKNFGQAAGETLASSQIGLGKSIGKIFGDSDGQKHAVEQMSKDQIALIRKIRENEAAGKDSTRLKQQYNIIYGNAAEVFGDFEKATTMPTTGQVVGQLGGTALDVLSAGTYGSATKGMTSFAKASKATSTVGNTATSVGLPELSKVAAQKSSGLFTKKGLGHVATGAGFGYASDVTQGLQGYRGENRTGSKAFIPGFGTAIGTAIPVISESVQSFKNATNPDIKAEKLINKRKSELDKLDRLQTVKRTVEKGRERGIDVKKVLSETDVLHGAVDKSGKITTKGEGMAVDLYRAQYIDGNENIVNQDP